jgi:hypothetical protein
MKKVAKLVKERLDFAMRQERWLAAHRRVDVCAEESEMG